MSAIRETSNSLEKKPRIEVYDWLRGMASLAVIFGHFKPFGLNKVFFVWAVHAFMMVTVVLVSQKSFGIEKLSKRLAYVGFIYAALFLLFRPLFILQNIQPVLPVSDFFFNLKTVFIENPYFAHLWYLLIYAQLLVFLFFMNKPLKKWDGRWVLLGALIVSDISFTLTNGVFNKYPTLVLPSWFFTMAVGLILLPKLAVWSEGHARHRGKRCILSLIVLALLWSSPELRGWLLLSHTRVSLFSSLIYFLCIYTVIEIYFIVSRLKQLDFLVRFVFLVSRYTLALYIYHQGLGRLLKPYAVPMEIVTPLSIFSGLLIGHLLHHAFLRLEKFFSALRIKSSALTMPEPLLPRRREQEEPAL